MTDASDLDERIREAKARLAPAMACPKGHTTGVREVRDEDTASRAWWCTLCGRRWRTTHVRT